MDTRAATREDDRLCKAEGLRPPARREQGDKAPPLSVMVVGAGPAGAIAARGLALTGAKVTMVDKARFPRRKVCGCCLNENALAALHSVGLGDLPAKLGAMPLHSFVTASAGRTATVPLKGVSLSRDALDMALIEEAVKVGVDFQEGVAQSGGTVSPCDAGARGHSPPAFMTVYANGLNGVPSSPSKSSRLGAGIILDDAPAFYEPGRIYMAVGRGGYVGLVQLEDGRLDVAAAFDPGFVKFSGGLAEAAAKIVKEAGFPDLLARSASEGAQPAIPDLAPSLALRANPTWKGTPALTRTPTRIAGPGWFAVGDAAGYVEPFTGEGMAWAISGAAAAVPFILRNDPDGWIREHRRIIGRRQRTCRGLARLLRAPGIYHWVVRGLNRFPGLARPVVQALNRKTAL